MSFLYEMAVSSTRKVMKESPDYSSFYPKYEKGQHWTADPKGEVKIALATSGMASETELPICTIPEMFAECVKTKGGRVALRSEQMPPLKPGEDVPGPIPLNQWKSWTFAEYYADCRKAAKAMIILGFEQHDAASILGFNSREWFIGNMAAILAGGKSAGKL